MDRCASGAAWRRPARHGVSRRVVPAGAQETNDAAADEPGGPGHEVAHTQTDTSQAAGVSPPRKPAGLKSL